MNERDHPAIAALEPDLARADDRKIRRVVAAVDATGDPAVNQMVLRSVRPRLAAIRPARPLRFARLLFTPLDPLTVPGRGWRLGDASVPRSVLAPLARAVHAALGPAAREIDLLVADHKTDAGAVITRAGERLWPEAASVLATCPPPAAWEAFGLPDASWGILTGGVAAVLRRAAALRRLSEDEALGALEPDGATLNAVVLGIAGEPEAGRTMVARLLALRSPGAAARLRFVFAPDQAQADRTAMRHALDGCLEPVLWHLEHASGFVTIIRHAPFADVEVEARRVEAVLAMFGDRPDPAQARRVTAVRARRADACRERLTIALQRDFAGPLDKVNRPLAGEAQTALETLARDLRRLHGLAVGPDGPAPDETAETALRPAFEAVRRAARQGILTPVRCCRLIEILIGADAAEALYHAVAAAST